MYNNKSILAIITARGGSKGVPLKNIKPLAGKPLIAWTIDQAKKSKYIDRLILSSEDERIIKAAEEWGCEVPFIRPAELARDDTPGIEPVLHAISALKEHYDYIMLLQPTSPLRSVEDIDKSIEDLIKNGAPACVSVSETEHSPYWMYRVDKSGNMSQVIDYDIRIARRQELPQVYELNGAIYIAKTDFLVSQRTFHGKQTIAYIMPAARSIDIDCAMDFACCEWLINNS
ncbi:MAG: cytidylyltransferase domain-containing protein [Deltaproteobacteria bacterium]